METSNIKDNEFDQEQPIDNAADNVAETIEASDDAAIEITEQATEPNEQTAQQWVLTPRASSGTLSPVKNSTHPRLLWCTLTRVLVK